MKKKWDKKLNNRPYMVLYWRKFSSVTCSGFQCVHGKHWDQWISMMCLKAWHIHTHTYTHTHTHIHSHSHRKRNRHTLTEWQTDRKTERYTVGVTWDLFTSCAGQVSCVRSEGREKRFPVWEGRFDSEEEGRGQSRCQGFHYGMPLIILYQLHLPAYITFD